MLNLKEKKDTLYGVRDRNRDLEAFNWLVDFIHEGKTGNLGLCYAICTRDSVGNLSIHRRISQPCVGGEMRTYASSHGKENCTRPDDYRPGDLRDPFPDGIPEALALPFNNSMITNKAANELIVRTLTEDWSPWRHACKGIELVKDDKGVVCGFIIINTDISPTLMVSMIRHIRMLGNIYSMNYVRELDVPMFAKQFYLPAFHKTTPIEQVRQVNHLQIRTLPVNSRNLMLGRVADGVCDKGTWRQRAAYNRPQIDYLFGQPNPKETLLDLIGLKHPTNEKELKAACFEIEEFRLKLVEEDKNAKSSQAA